MKDVACSHRIISGNSASTSWIFINHSHDQRMQRAMFVRLSFCRTHN
jgi:hypothetical protein